MNWDILGAISETIGAIAVIVTLAYLAVQIRQNTLQIRNEGHINISDSYREIIGNLLHDNDLFRLVVLGCQDWNNLTAFEQSRFHAFFHQHLDHFRLAVQLHRKGSIDQDVYDSIESLHIRVLANPGARVWWNMVGKSLVEKDLIEFIDRKLSEVEGAATSTTEAWEFYNPRNWEID